MINMKFILIFDIPHGKESFRRTINRKLHRMKIIKLQQSVWKSNNLNDLMQIASTIKQEGGRATILKEENVVSY